MGQFASYYYTPSLLTKIWKRTTLSKVPNLQQIALYPEVKNLKVEAGHVRANLVDRGGGFGDVHVFVNNMEVKTIPGSAHVDVNLGAKLQGLANPDVRLYVYNAQNTIHSRSTMNVASGLDSGPLPNPKIIAVVGSVQHYASPNLDLSYTDADALSVTKALLAMSKGLNAEIHVELVCDDKSARDLVSSAVTLHQADKTGFEAAFTLQAKRADAGSVFFVYLSGHGAALAKDGGKSNEYYYLTRDATDGVSAWFREPAAAKQWALSGSEIREYLARALDCRRRFLVLDTCSAGASKEQLLALRGEAEDQARARREFQQGTGTFALMGAAEGKSSLEAAEYGHGILTYALLQTLKFSHLGNEKSPDMVLAAGLVAQTKSTTRTLAEAINRGQEPVAISPSESGSVVLGQMDDAARRSILLSTRLPILLRPLLIDADSGDASLADELADYLREMSLRSRDAVGATVFAGYLPEDAAPDAYRLQGPYSEANGLITVRARVYRNRKQELRPFPPVVAAKQEIAAKLAEALRLWLADAGPEK